MKKSLMVLGMPVKKLNKRQKHRGFQPLDSQQVARCLGGR
ncbi:hypothetical protein PTUN_a2918 [Pseudoalteromonas tunicata]|nr:hypothetical protein PTUN_a2918 [Pseudoalteromonas tunicata]